MRRHGGYSDLDRALSIFWESIKDDPSPEAESFRKEIEQEDLSFTKTSSGVTPPTIGGGVSGLSYEDLATFEARKIPGGAISDPKEFFNRLQQADVETYLPVNSSNLYSDELDEYETFEDLVRNIHQKQAQQQIEKPDDTKQQQGWNPKYQVGTRIINKNTRETGLIIDISQPTQKYIVRYDNNPNPVLVSEDELTLPEEFIKPLEQVTNQDKEEQKEETTQQLNDLLFQTKTTKEKEQQGLDASEVLKKILTDPQVAPVVIEKMLESGIINPSQALNLLSKVGAIPKND